MKVVKASVLNEPETLAPVLRVTMDIPLFIVDSGISEDEALQNISKLYLEALKSAVEMVK